MNTIVWTPAAAKQLRKLSRPVQTAIRDAVSLKLSRFPNCSGVKSLADHVHGFRLRVGDYRVIFDFDGTIKLVRIEQVGRRNERTY